MLDGYAADLERHLYAQGRTVPAVCGRCGEPLESDATNDDHPGTHYLPCPECGWKEGDEIDEEET